MREIFVEGNDDTLTHIKTKSVLACVFVSNVCATFLGKFAVLVFFSINVV
jgi:hypothetical protein